MFHGWIEHLAGVGSEVTECSVLFVIIKKTACEFSWVALVNETIGWVRAIFSQVPAIVGRVPETVGRVPLTFGRRRGEIVVEHHTYLTPYIVKPGTSNIFHK
jgi:hypothetical protein